MNKNNGLANFGLGLILVTAFALASVAAYQSIIGLADLFAARAEVIIVMAVFIEFAKLLFAGALHMFWREIPWWKWLGVGIIGIHMAVTNIGIWSYLSTGYTLQEAPVATIERRIEVINGSIASETIIEQEVTGRITAMDTAYQALVERIFTTRAEKYQKDNAEMRAQLEAQQDEARAEIARLEAVRVTLKEQMVANAAKLGSIEHLSAFTDGSREDILQIVALFTLLLMLGLDPAAIMMVILFAFLLSKKIGTPDVSPIDALDDDTKAAVEHLDKIGYLKNRKKSNK